MVVGDHFLQMVQIVVSDIFFVANCKQLYGQGHPVGQGGTVTPVMDLPKYGQTDEIKSFLGFILFMTHTWLHIGCCSGC